MNLDQTKKQFRILLDRGKAIQHAASIIHWDAATGAPKKGVNFRAKTLGILSGEIYKLLVSDEMKGFLETLEAHNDELDEVTKKLVKEVRKQYDQIMKIPAEEYQAYSELCAKATAVWEEAKRKSDFSMFAPYLEDIVGYLRKFVEYRGYKGHPYNTLLDDYEPGMTVEKLDEFFSTLKKRIVPLVNKVQNSDKKIKKDFLTLSYPTDKQHEFSLYLLEELGFDMDAGMLKESEHPFTMGLDPSDVRLTTHYYEKDVISAMYSTIHEGGHAVYEQNIDMSLSGTLLATGTSMGIHESQSRTFENLYGRNINFWKYFYPKLVETFPEQLSNVTLEEFYEAVNEAKPSLIRVDADELTYSLHIMVRYEIEKALFEGKIETRDLPKIWNEKIEEYFGLTPSNDAEGVLQDTHWSSGLFGYFPSYALGNAYASQFEQTMRKTLDIDKLLAVGNYKEIEDWLRENIHKHGALKEPNEIIKDTTGEELNPIYFIEYLEEKFSKLYNL